MDLSFYILILLHFSLFLSPISSSGSLHLVDRCPTIESWGIRSRTFRCVNSNHKYHCLRTVNNTYAELCLQSSGLSAKRGCPVLMVSNNSFRIQQAECVGNAKSCPHPDVENYFASDKLYKYPACLSVFKEEQTAGLTSEIHKQSTTVTLQPSRRKFSLPTAKSRSHQGSAHVLVSSYPTEMDRTTFTMPSLMTLESGTFTTTSLRQQTKPTTSTKDLVFMIGGSLIALVLLAMGAGFFILIKHVKSLKSRLSISPSIPNDPMFDNFTRPKDKHDSVIYDEIETSSKGSDSYVEPNAPIGLQRMSFRIETKNKRGTIDENDYIEPVEKQLATSDTDVYKVNEEEISSKSPISGFTVIDTQQLRSDTFYNRMSLPKKQEQYMELAPYDALTHHVYRGIDPYDDVMGFKEASSSESESYVEPIATDVLQRVTSSESRNVC